MHAASNSPDDHLVRPLPSASGRSIPRDQFSSSCLWRPPAAHNRSRSCAEVACPNWIYGNRNRVERLWARLKEWRAVATRYEKTARSFLGILCVAAALDWLRR
jgi:transposase